MDGKESFGIIASGTIFVINLYMFTRMCLQSFSLRGATTVLNAHSEIHRNKVSTLEPWVFGKGILGGGFKDFFFSTLPGEDSHVD